MNPPPAQITFHFESFLLRQGWVDNLRLTTRNGLVETIQTDQAALPGDVRLGVGLPGMPNLHSHAFQRGMAGLAEIQGANGDSFWTWRDVMYRFVEKISPDQLVDIAALAYIEMLESGFTRVGEFHYLHHDRNGQAFDNPAAMSAAIAQAAHRSGIGLTHLPVFYAHSDFGGKPPEPHQSRFICSLDSFARLLGEIETVMKALPDAVVGIAPHSLRAVTPQELDELVQHAPNRPMHIHIAEQPKEVAACQAWSGARPVQWLLDHAPIAPNWCLVHATHVTDPEITAMARSGAIAGLCPITEANLGDGIFPARKFLAQNGAYGIGSDSNVRIDMTEELRMLEYSQRLRDGSRNVMAMAAGRSTGQDMYQAAVAGGQQALGQGPAMAPGAPADFITLDTENPTLLSRGAEHMIDSLIFGAGRRAIDGVWRRASQVVVKGAHHDRARLAQNYKTTLATLLAQH